jgi:succinyl-CoA synthetase beta subunit/citryl-CoA synthetase large subunit
LYIVDNRPKRLLHEENAVRLLEFESKEILNRYQIITPSGTVIEPPKNIDIDLPVMLKAQIPVGGRGKAGGILGATTLEEAKAGVQQLASNWIRGYRANKILVEEKTDIDREFYLAITYDTVAKAPMAIFSAEGGIEIETLARQAPQKIRNEHFSIRSGLPQYRAREIISETGISGRLLLGLGTILSRLADVFADFDATLAEINPLALTPDGRLVALDCHLEIDDDAVFRHAELAEIAKADSRYEAERRITDFERRAAEVDQLDHRGVAGRVIEFDGNMGLIIGGGGASLTAFDAVRFHGGQPANYCEIGGNPSVLKVKELTRLLLSKPKVEKIAVIMNVVSNTRVDLVARGIVKGILEAGKDPAEIVAAFRIPGAWEEEGFKILSKYGIPFLDRTASIDDAARMAVENAT